MTMLGSVLASLENRIDGGRRFYFYSDCFLFLQHLTVDDDGLHAPNEAELATVG